MDSANKQDAVVVETTQGTTPASPAFKLLRTSSISGTPQRNAVRSPERRADRAAFSMVSGLSSFRKTINLPWVRDAATDILLASTMCAAFATNVLKNGSTIQPFTLEEKYEGGATDPYRRLAGATVDRFSFQLQVGQPGTMSFDIVGLSESMATTAIASSTYANPSPGTDPSSPIDIVVNSLFGLTAPKVMGLSGTITNSLREQYKFGSDSPFGTGLGLFDVSLQLQVYFSQAADYQTFMTRQTGLALDLTVGATAGSKDQIQMNTADVWNPDISDPGPTGDHMVTLQAMGRFNAADAAVLKWTRNV